MEYEVTHNEGEHRFEASENGHIALVEYQILDRHLMNIYHTEVPKPVESSGLGSALMKEVLSFARKNHYRVLPTCAFAQVYVGMHPNHQDMLV
ncbi:MAG: N-acetyltransferase [Odoribacter sp.]|nr:N-acetyltransferase [Odoribacter sp.]